MIWLSTFIPVNHLEYVWITFVVQLFSVSVAVRIPETPESNVYHPGSRIQG
jgi:hypothetical protein